MFKSLRHIATLGGLAVVVVSPLVVAPSAGASTTSSGIVASILGTSDQYLTSLRTYFLCTSAKCKSERSTLERNARTAMAKISAQSARAVTAHVAPKYHGALTLFVSDVRQLAKSFHVYFTTTSTVTLSGEVGNIFFQTSDIGTDVNVLRAAARNTRVSFKDWVEGEAATLVAMQTDASALQSSTATAAIGIYANQLLSQECTSMIAHANGPNATFNRQLAAFARNQARISQSEILFLEGKKAPMTEAQVASLNVKVAAQFAALIKSESALVKKK